MITVTFDQPGDFEAVNAARQWCREHDVSYGSMQGPAPIGLLYGEYAISKWRNMNSFDIERLDGRMTGDMRNGPVTITICEPTAIREQARGGE